MADVDELIARSERWGAEMREVRGILLDRGLDEQVKWAKPCYSHGGANVAILQEMQRFLAVMFFKGSLIDDPDGLLEEQGPNSRSARRIVIGSVDDVATRRTAIGELVDRAIAVEDAGLELGPTPEPDLVPELQERLDGDPALRAAFEALTPGRRREYHLHIAGAKRHETRVARVEQHAPRILQGKGLRDR